MVSIDGPDVPDPACAGDGTCLGCGHVQEDPFTGPDDPCEVCGLDPGEECANCAPPAPARDELDVSAYGPPGGWQVTNRPIVAAMVRSVPVALLDALLHARDRAWWHDRIFRECAERWPDPATGPRYYDLISTHCVRCGRSAVGAGRPGDDHYCGPPYFRPRGDLHPSGPSAADVRRQERERMREATVGLALF